jgi:hypothetical protein
MQQKVSRLENCPDENIYNEERHSNRWTEKIINQELHNLCFLQNVLKVIWSRRIK